MREVRRPPRAVYAAAAEALAERIVRALTDSAEEYELADQLGVEDGLAAVRVLGADVLTPHLLTQRPFTDRDAKTIAASFDMFPAAEDDPPVVCARDWALRASLARLTGQPEPPFPAVAGVDHGRDWLGLAAWLAPLAPLVTPGLSSPVHLTARARALDVARGASRAVMRRDYPAAARLARWLSVGPPVSAVSSEALLRHVELFGAADARVRLDLTLARALTQ